LLPLIQKARIQICRGRETSIKLSPTKGTTAKTPDFIEVPLDALPFVSVRAGASLAGEKLAGYC
jgi:hypothetical protein